MKFENTAVMNFANAIRGMRNPMNSWDKSDSTDLHEIVLESAYSPICFYPDVQHENFVLGNKDMSLAQKLIKAGSEHRKFMRQIFVSVDITAPIYWWSEFDTYKVGTTSDSCSKMHTLLDKPFDIYDFGFDTPSFYIFLDEKNNHVDNMKFQFFIVDLLNKLRDIYLNKLSDEKNKKRIWRYIVQILPSSYNQKRTITMTYENIFSICKQRKSHKLNEWSGIDCKNVQNFIGWANCLPYADKLIFLD